MKNLFLCLFILPNAFTTSAQQNGKILTNSLTPKAGSANTYFYYPPKNAVLPEKLRASIIYYNKERFKEKIILKKDGDRFSFSFKAPDSTSVLLIAIIDYYNNVIDNNKGSGYISYLHDDKGRNFKQLKIIKAKLLSDGYASYFHQIMIPTDSTLKLYEDGFKFAPSLKSQNFYFDYLILMYKANSESAKPMMLNYANKMIKTSANESNWINASIVYGILEMKEQQKETEKKILAFFPTGRFARDRFWNNFFELSDTSESEILTKMIFYKTKFNDSSSISLNNFYSKLIDFSVKTKNIDLVIKYGEMIDDKLLLASKYNQIAWDLAGGGIKGTAVDLNLAKRLSRYSINLIDDMFKRGFIADDPDELVGAQFYYTDTYALILYKSNDVDSAFIYQNKLLKTGLMTVAGMETYSFYAEKAMGQQFAKDFIESQLNKGLNSQIMVDQLEEIYKKLGLPEAKLRKVKEINSAGTRIKASEEITKKLGTLKSPEFNLKDLNGETISLSSLSGKVIVLDFWATWCIPCMASFPKMNELVNKYKNTNKVEFLFVDIWEKEDKKIKVNKITKFLKENSYDFRILLDEKDQAVNSYKVGSIPVKFVIDKRGKLIYMGNDEKLLSLIIEAATEEVDVE